MYGYYGHLACSGGDWHLFLVMIMFFFSFVLKSVYLHVTYESFIMVCCSEHAITQEHSILLSGNHHSQHNCKEQCVVQAHGQESRLAPGPLCPLGLEFCTTSLPYLSAIWFLLFHKFNKVKVITIAFFLIVCSEYISF